MNARVYCDYGVLKVFWKMFKEYKLNKNVIEKTKALWFTLYVSVCWVCLVCVCVARVLCVR